MEGEQPSGCGQRTQQRAGQLGAGSSEGAGTEGVRDRKGRTEVRTPRMYQLSVMGSGYGVQDGSENPSRNGSSTRRAHGFSPKGGRAGKEEREVNRRRGHGGHTELRRQRGHQAADELNSPLKGQGFSGRIKIVTSRSLSSPGHEFKNTHLKEKKNEPKESLSDGFNESLQNLR